MDELTEIKEALRRYGELILKHRLTAMHMEAQIEVLQGAFASLCEQMGAASKDGIPIQEDLENKTRNLLELRLADMADRDPALASAYKRLLETGKLHP